MSEPCRHALPIPQLGLAAHPTHHTWESAFHTHYVELCEYVLRFVGSAGVAEDLVHDLFLRLWDTRARSGSSMGVTRAYLYVAARNRALKYLRHRRVAAAWIERAAREEAPTALSPEDLYLRHELGDAVARAIADLPTRCREIFILRRQQQLSYQEIASHAGVSLGTVKSQMWRAAVQLKEKLAPYLFIL
jgi:RNA polymerase sigma-70 factor, ECF subfamily